MLEKNGQGHRKEVTSFFRMVGNKEWKIHISSWEEFLDHIISKQGSKLLRG